MRKGKEMIKANKGYETSSRNTRTGGRGGCDRCRSTVDRRARRLRQVSQHSGQVGGERSATVSPITGTGLEGGLWQKPQLGFSAAIGIALSSSNA